MHGSLRHRATPRFWRHYNALPIDVQHVADAAYKLLKADTSHPSLHLKKVGKYWSARVGLHYRVLSVQEGNDVVWFWIGHHTEYERLISA